MDPALLAAELTRQDADDGSGQFVVHSPLRKRGVRLCGDESVAFAEILFQLPSYGGDLS